MTSAPVAAPRSSVVTGLGGGGGGDEVGGTRQVRGSGSGEGGGRERGAMMDSYLSSFNSVALPTTTTTTTHPRLEDCEEEDDVFHDNVPPPPHHPFTLHKKGPAPQVPHTPSTLQVPRGSSQMPPSAPSQDTPGQQVLSDLPGLSIVTWEEFSESPLLLCGLFKVDRDDFIRYNAQHVNVFFHDSRMDQPTLGSPSGDGLSW
ncbi:hypothetical protein ACOMHN_031230 [Nucella lapillus]